MEKGKDSSNRNVKKENPKKMKAEYRISKRRESSDSDSDDENDNTRPTQKEFIWNTVLLINNFSPQHSIAGWSMEALEKSLGSDYLRYFGRFVEPKMFKPGAKTWREVFESPYFKPIFKLTTRQRHPVLFATEPIREGKIAKLTKMASYASCRLSDDPIFNMLLKLPPLENTNIDDRIAERIQQILNFDGSKLNKNACRKIAVKRQIMSLASNLPGGVKTISLSSDSEDSSDEVPNKKRAPNPNNVVSNKPCLTVAVPACTLPKLPPVVAETANNNCTVTKPATTVCTLPKPPSVAKTVGDDGIVPNSSITENPIVDLCTPPKPSVAKAIGDDGIVPKSTFTKNPIADISTLPEPPSAAKAFDDDHGIVPKSSVIGNPIADNRTLPKPPSVAKAVDDDGIVPKSSVKENPITDICILPSLAVTKSVDIVRNAPMPHVISVAEAVENTVTTVLEPTVRIDAVGTTSKSTCTTPTLFSMTEAVENVEVPKTFLSIEMPGFANIKAANTVQEFPISGTNNALRLILVSYNKSNESLEEEKASGEQNSSVNPISNTPIPKSFSSIRSNNWKPIGYSSVDKLDNMFDRRPIVTENVSPLDFSDSSSSPLDLSSSGSGLQIEEVRSLALDCTSRFGSPQACSTQLARSKSFSYSFPSQETIIVKENSSFSESQLHSQRPSLRDEVERYPGSSFERKRLVEQRGLCNTLWPQKDDCSVLVVDIKRLCRDAWVDDLQDIFSEYGYVKKAMVSEGRYGQIEMSYSSALNAKQRLSKRYIVYDEDGNAVFSFQVRDILANKMIDAHSISISSVFGRNYMDQPRAPNNGRLIVKVILEWELKKYNEFAELLE